jgi:hypothetical protein
VDADRQGTRAGGDNNGGRGRTLTGKGRKLARRQTTTALLRHYSYRARFYFLSGKVSVLMSTCRGILWKIFQNKIDPGLNLDLLAGQPI